MIVVVCSCVRVLVITVTSLGGLVIQVSSFVRGLVILVVSFFVREVSDFSCLLRV